VHTSFCGGPGSRRDELQRKSFGRRARPGSTGTDAEKRLAVPVLLVYALILRPYVLDLVPGNSLVGYLVGEGFDVYLLDWGVRTARIATSRSSTTYWPIWRRWLSGFSQPPEPELPTLDVDGEGRFLAVFGFEEEAETFLGLLVDGDDEKRNGKASRRRRES
jgi:hypothetical protein